MERINITMQEDLLEKIDDARVHTRQNRSELIRAAAELYTGLVLTLGTAMAPPPKKKKKDSPEKIRADLIRLGSEVNEYGEPTPEAEAAWKQLAALDEKESIL